MSELYFARSFHGHPSWRYLARPSMHIWPIKKKHLVCCQCETPDVAGEEHLGFIDTEPENESPHKLEVRVFNWPDRLLHARGACDYICLACMFSFNPSVFRFTSDFHRNFVTVRTDSRILKSPELKATKNNVERNKEEHGITQRMQLDSLVLKKG